MRLIDADQVASIENLDQYSDLAAALGDVQTVRDVLSDAPTVDAVPVTRCRLCKHGKCGVDNIVKCSHPCGKVIYMTAEDFCSYGQKD